MVSKEQRDKVLEMLRLDPLQSKIIIRPLETNSPDPLAEKLKKLDPGMFASLISQMIAEDKNHPWSPK